MGTKENIVGIIGNIREVAIECDTVLGMCVSQEGDPPDIVESKADQWSRDYPKKLRQIRNLIKELEWLDARL